MLGNNGPHTTQKYPNRLYDAGLKKTPVPFCTIGAFLVAGWMAFPKPCPANGQSIALLLISPTGGSEAKKAGAEEEHSGRLGNGA